MEVYGRSCESLHQGAAILRRTESKDSWARLLRRAGTHTRWGHDVPSQCGPLGHVSPLLTWAQIHCCAVRAEPGQGSHGFGLLQGSSSTSQFRSPGELPTSSDATREAPTRPAKAQMWPSSPGQLPSSEPSSPGEVVGGSEPGEVPAFAGAASVGEVSVGELEPPGPGQGPWAHLDQRSSGEVSSFEVANAS